MIDEQELSRLLDLDRDRDRDLAERPSAPPLAEVVHRGRRLRRRRQTTKAVSVVAAAVAVVGLARVMPSPSQEIRTASIPGEHTPAPEGGAGPQAATPTTVPTTAGPKPHREGPKEPVVTPTTSTTVPPTTTTTKPIPHSSVVTSNGKLAGLIVTGLSPAFAADTAYYTAPGDEHDGMMVTATLADPAANLYIQSTRVNSGQPFKAWVGDGKSVDIVIYSDWTEIGRYVITKPGDTPPPPPAPHSTVTTDNGRLAGLTATGLSPAFDPATLTYTAAADHDMIVVTATLADPNANLSIQSTKVNSGQSFRAWVGDGKSVDIVIYSDWTEIGRYTITRSN